MWPKVITFVLLGYLCMARSFAHIGIPQYDIYIGEVVLVAFILSRPGVFIGFWLRSLFVKTSLSSIAWFFFILLQYGIFQLIRGLDSGYLPSRVLKTFVINYYPLYLFIGFWVGLERANYLPRFFRMWSWFHGLYGLASIVFLSRLKYTMPGAPEVPMFGLPGGSAIIILGLLAFEPSLVNWIVWVPLLMNFAVLIGLQARADWVGFAVGLLIWGIMQKKLYRVLVALWPVFLLLAIAYATNLRIKGPRGYISTRDSIGRALSSVDRTGAAEFSPDAARYAGTVEWRTSWWKVIWTKVNSDASLAMIGFGYGYPIYNFVPYLRGDVDLRSPHNFVLLILVYTGWLGLAIFLLFLHQILRAQWRAYKLTGSAFGVMYFFTFFTTAAFSNLLETPFGSIPFYTLMGVSLATVFRAQPGAAESPVVLPQHWAGIAGPRPAMARPSPAVREGT